MEIAELGLTGLDRLECRHALRWREPVEILAVGLARPGVGGGDAGREEFARRERKLVAVLGLAFAERAAAVHFCTATPGTGELAIAERDQSAIASRRREFVRGDHGV